MLPWTCLGGFCFLMSQAERHKTAPLCGWRKMAPYPPYPSSSPAETGELLPAFIPALAVYKPALRGLLWDPSRPRVNYIVFSPLAVQLAPPSSLLLLTYSRGRKHYYFFSLAYFHIHFCEIMFFLLCWMLSLEATTTFSLKSNHIMY